MKTDQELANQLRDLLQRAGELAQTLSKKGYTVRFVEGAAHYWTVDVSRCEVVEL